MSKYILFIDLETGGLTPGHSILEVGALLCRDERDYPIEAIYDQLVSADTYLTTEKALKVNGLDLNQCRNEGVPLNQIAADLVDYAKPLRPRIAGWNVGFDYGFIQRQIPALAEVCSFRTLDIQSVFSFFYGEMGLGQAAANLGVERGTAHRALGDVYTTRNIAIALRGRL